MPPQHKVARRSVASFSPATAISTPYNIGVWCGEGGYEGGCGCEGSGGCGGEVVVVVGVFTVRELEVGGGGGAGGEKKSRLVSRIQVS